MNFIKGVIRVISSQVRLLIVAVSLVVLGFMTSCTSKDSRKRSTNKNETQVAKVSKVETEKYDLPFNSLLEDVNYKIKGIWDSERMILDGWGSSRR